MPLLVSQTSPSLKGNTLPHAGLRPTPYLLNVRCLFLAPSAYRIDDAAESLTPSQESWIWPGFIQNKIRIYYRSGIGKKLMHMRRQMSHFHSPGGSTFLHEVTSWPPSSKCDVRSKIRLCQSIHIYLKNNPDKFHCDLIWNDGASGVFEEMATRARIDKWQMTNDFITPRPLRS